MKKLLAILLALLLALQMTASLAATYTDAETILAVQQALHDKGYYKGNLSGIKGNATEAAIRAYQQANGLNATGNIDDDLLAKLGLTQGSAGEEAPASNASDNADVKTEEAAGAVTADSVSVDFSGLLKKEPVTLADQDGVTIKATGISYNAEYEQLSISLTASNANSCRVAISFSSIRLNGKNYDCTVRSIDSIGVLFMPEQTENMRCTLVIQPDGTPLPSLEELKNGQIFIAARTAATDELAQKHYLYWPVLFTVDAVDFVFDMAAEPAADALRLPFLRIEKMEEAAYLIYDGQLFSLENVTLNIEEGYGIFISRYRFDLRGTLTNDTDSELAVFMEDFSFNGTASNGKLYLRAEDGTALDAIIPAHSTVKCTLSMNAPSDMDIADISEISCTVRYLDVSTEKNVFVQPVCFVMGEDDAPSAETVAETAADGAIVLPVKADFFSVTNIPLFSVGELSFDYDYIAAEGSLYYIAGYLSNKTDHDLSIRFKSCSVDGNSAFALLGLTDINNDTSFLNSVPAHSQVRYDLSIDSLENISVASMQEMTCTLYCADAASQEVVLQQPLTFVFQH